MKKIEDMSYEELKEEIKYTVSILDEQPLHHEAYLAGLAEALADKAFERLGGKSK